MLDLSKENVSNYVFDDVNVPVIVTPLDSKKMDGEEIHSVDSQIFPVAIKPEKITVEESGKIYLENPPKNLIAESGKVRVEFYFNKVGLFFVSNIEKDIEIATSLSVLGFSIFSLVILIRICLPFDIYRVFLVIGLVFVSGIVMVADYFAQSPSFNLGINYSVLNEHNAAVLSIVLLVSLVLYILISFGASKLHKFIDKKREEKKYDHF